MDESKSRIPPAADPWDDPKPVTPAMPPFVASPYPASPYPVSSVGASPSSTSGSATPASSSEAAPPTMYGRAKVPTGTQGSDSLELDGLSGTPAAAVRSTKPISWQRASRSSLRSLSDGWGLSATGLLVAFCGWGVWAAAGRGSIASPLTGLVFMLLVAVGVFALSRLLGYVVLTQMLNRRRLHARWAHLAAGLFLTAGGIAYFANTRLVLGADEWIQGAWDWARSLWERA